MTTDNETYQPTAAEMSIVWGEVPTSGGHLGVIAACIEPIIKHYCPGLHAIGFAPVFATPEDAATWDNAVKKVKG